MLNAELLKLGFTRCRSDSCVYLRVSNKGRTIIVIHVDDMILAASTKRAMTELKEDFRGLPFETTELGEPRTLLGMTVFRNRDKGIISLSQTHYLHNVLERFAMMDCKPISTPMDPSTHLSNEQSPRLYSAEWEEMRKYPYAALVGALMYAALATRPDLAYTVNTLAQYMSNPGMEHWHAAKRVLRYVKGTLDLALTYGGDENDWIPVGYTDADFAES
ncbi:hypothetical protein HETIRDRAFT_222124, partial [Heterobasidion irregulare TC 32-1]